MIFKQYYLGCLAHASYLIGDEVTHEAAVVDPQRDIDQYQQDSKDLNLRIGHVFLTHFHADFLAGHLELRKHTGARIYLGAQAKAEYPFTPLADGQSVEFGKIRLSILETPGHSPESICIVVYDLGKEAETPYAVLTGDTLFVGDVGRPDLRASLGFSATQLGKMLYKSLHEKLLKLPDETLVYPAHGAGSLCGKSLSTETVSTLGAQRQYNYAVQPMHRDEFVRLVTAEQPDAPSYFTYDAILNTKERPTLDKTLEQVLKPLPLAELWRLKEEGGQLLDVRDAAEFSAAHLSGSINIGLAGQFATWAGTILDRSKPILIIASPGHEREAVMRLGRIGFDHVAGYLEAGMNAAAERPDLVQRTNRVAASVLVEQLASPSPPLLVDVRNDQERLERRIEGSLHVPLNRIEEKVADIPNDRELVVHCAGGYRSSVAASVLKKRGIEKVSDLLGGISAWQKSGLPIVEGPSAKTTAAVKPTEYAEAILELSGGKVRLTSYKVGDRYYCKADIVEPAACISRSEGKSKETAEQEVLAHAEEYLSRTRRV